MKFRSSAEMKRCVAGLSDPKETTVAAETMPIIPNQ